MDLIPQLKAARRAGTPLICIRTADPAATIQSIAGQSNGDSPPFLQWDIVGGIKAINKEGSKAISALGDIPEVLGAVDALVLFAKLPERSVVFMHNIHRVINETGVSQAIWNLRNPFKLNSRTLIMLCPTVDLPIEIQQDVLVLDEPLPDESQLAEIVRNIYVSAELEPPEQTVIDKAVDATSGLAAFPAEQVCAMSISKKGLDLPALWDRKRSVIEQQRGLSVWRGTEKFSDIGGYDNLKTFLRAVLKGRRPPRGIVFLDEIEKSIGTGQDTSGVSQNMLGQLLTYMQDKESTGLLLIGPPGTSKSMFAKATGNEGNIPTIALDLGGMKGSLVGESEGNLRGALKVCEAVTQNRALFLATCNSIGALPPELRRRFVFGVFFCDLPEKAERLLIWDLYVKKYGLSKQAFPVDDGWTGAEIKQCCSLAYDLNMPLVQASEFIVPVSRSASDQILRLREQASGKYISASYPGVYQYQQAHADVQVTQVRKLDLKGGVN